jgi:hypothetical protein
MGNEYGYRPVNEGLVVLVPRITLLLFFNKDTAPGEAD